MGHHILIPLDGSALAEGVLPHAIALGKVFNSQITLIHVIEPITPWGRTGVIDPLEWQIIKTEAQNYLKTKSDQVKSFYDAIDYIVTEGQPAEKIIETGAELGVDLIALSSHGKSGLSEWNISSVVQKIIMRSKKSILLVRAYHLPLQDARSFTYKHLMVPLDCSQRAEFVLQMAAHLTNYFRANLLLTHIMQKPEISCRMPASSEDQSVIDRFIQRQEQEVHRYFEQLRAQMSITGIEFHSFINSRSDIASALHEVIEHENIDLVLLTAHGHTGSSRWPYGSIATNFIVYGTTPLLILQDLKPDDIELSMAEQAVVEKRGR